MRIKRVATVATLALVGITGISVAMPVSASAGGIGDFYNSTSCSPAYHPELKGRVTNYDVYAYTAQRYHHSSNTYNGYYPAGMNYDGHPWPFSGYGNLGHSGTVADGYQTFSNPFVDHTLYFTWKNGKGGVLVAKCRAI